MSERGPEISNMEKKFTIGKVEKPVEQKILAISEKITESGIFREGKTEQERMDKLDEVVRLASDGVIDDYKDLIDKSCDENLDQQLINQTFDVLKKGSSLSINNDVELQTKLNIGGIGEIIPDGAKYDNMGNSRFSLEKGIMEVTITNPKIRKIYREIEGIRSDYDLDDPFERKQAADEIAEQRKELLTLRKEIFSDDQRQEWVQAKEYLKMEVGILDGELNNTDGSADKADVVAVLGQAMEQINMVAKKRAETMDNVADIPVDKFKEGLDQEELQMLKRDEEAMKKAVLESKYDRENYRSPYETTPGSFVQSLLNYEDPRLYFTPPPEWVSKLTPAERYLLKIQKKLAVGAQYYLGVKDISADKARSSEVYNFPTTELKLLYEMPLMREAMETFANDFFELYEEDGRSFKRLKQCKDVAFLKLTNDDKKKGYVLELGHKNSKYYKDENGDIRLAQGKNKGKHIIDPRVARWLGDTASEYGFEDYKEERWKKMVLSRIFNNDPNVLMRINRDIFDSGFNDEANDFIRRKMKENPNAFIDYINQKKGDDPNVIENFIKDKREYDDDQRSDAELESELMSIWNEEMISKWKNEWMKENSWGGVYNQVIENYIKESREDFKKRYGGNKKDNRTDAELENEWIEKNALQEERVWACTALFALVGQEFPSADIYRQLKPTQVMSDKVRTFMMPLEKFLQKGSYRNVGLDKTEEPFGKAYLWAREQYKREGRGFADKLIKAADTDRRDLSDQEAMYRIYPKRTMCSFMDMHKVEVEGGVKVTMSEALLRKRKINFTADDLDVFKNLRDTWDELLTVSPLLIGKADFNPVQQPDKLAMAVEKLKGVIHQVSDVRSVDKNGKKGFGREIFMDNPETYAWMIANSVGLQNDYDIPILDLSAMKANERTYHIYINGFMQHLSLENDIAVKVKKILNGYGEIDSYKIVKGAMSRAGSRQSKKQREQRSMVKKGRWWKV